MIIADTNVVSEFMRPRPDPAVLHWARSVGTDELHISVITVQEIQYGVESLPAGQRRAQLTRAWERMLDLFERRTLAFDNDSAQYTARILAQARSQGRPMSVLDAQIVGTCVAHGAALATRNTRDFTGVDGLRLIDPFATPSAGGR
ncbi:type II toxin-antitoxin system VapC family toxin [Brachybacterium sp. UMB0905]|uniref:type II toxin-antitoxin system VapC family toxin n=1 Tax=Brachybacterium sp. UMB0905 TaxID=2069310 RepID=UPI000C804DA9|nr:type II toxin-antitoxin system VapC family toxin [Brachybacterium sp. UMB0905]PMC74553.1 VapC toxin family PIN domain ribonuclease [Brachybacterium sp. UMB0905]